MHQAKKGNEWHFGMKMHAGVDADSGLVRSVVCTVANESDIATRSVRASCARTSSGTSP